MKNKIELHPVPDYEARKLSPIEVELFVYQSVFELCQEDMETLQIMQTDEALPEEPKLRNMTLKILNLAILYKQNQEIYEVMLDYYNGLKEVHG